MRSWSEIFAFFSCREPKKCQKKVHTFHLQGVTLFTYRGSHFAPAEFTLFTCRGHTSHLQGIQKKCQKTIWTSPLQRSEWMPKESSHFHLEAFWKNAKRKFPFFTRRGSHFLLAGSPKNTCFGPHAREKFSVNTDNKHGVPWCSSSKTEIICPHWAQMSNGSVKAHFDGPIDPGSGRAASQADFRRLRVLSALKRWASPARLSLSSRSSVFPAIYTLCPGNTDTKYGFFFLNCKREFVEKYQVSSQEPVLSRQHLFRENFDHSSIPLPPSFLTNTSWHHCRHLHWLWKFLHALLNAPLSSKHHSCMSQIFSPPCSMRPFSSHLISVDLQLHWHTSQWNSRPTRQKNCTDWHIPPTFSAQNLILHLTNVIKFNWTLH